MLSTHAHAEIDREVSKYPDGRQQAAVMAALRIAQQEKGWLSEEVIEYVAGLLGLEPIQVAEVATFYSMYDLEPVGRHKICVCTNISCMLRGSDDVVAHLQRRLGIKVGQTSADGRFSLRSVECLAACGGAPMMQIGKRYYENLTPASIDEILDGLE
ncbi:MAG: NADH-quinone oxidoreductase subunit NuoE [Gammaproteobacteria bacterium]|nr:NADH-quinone oxidoreductase subunit NuoE [Gammaproteobacteria bacterium]MDH3466596.1 NADH-quinone oxidoreductase subunit NuoE [Gammaproteobacteria bacterium]